MIHHNALSLALAAASIGLPLTATTWGVDQPDTSTTTRQPDQPRDRNMNRDTGRETPQNSLKNHDMMSDQPGELHDWLKTFEGSWDIVAEPPSGGWKDMNDANRTLSESDRMAKKTGMAKSEMVLDGRFAHMIVTCNDKANGFEGTQVFGYNNNTHRFESVWTDNHCTGITLLTGELSSDRKVLTLTGEDPKSSHAGAGWRHASGEAPTKTTAGQPGSPGSSTGGTTGTGAGGPPGSGAAKPEGNDNDKDKSNTNERMSGTGANMASHIRQVIRWNSPSSFVSEVYKPNMSGGEERMVITFTKRDAGSMGAAPTTNP